LRRRLGFSTWSCSRTPLGPAGFAAVQFFETAGRPTKLLFELPDLSSRVLDFLAVLACFGFVGWSFSGLGQGALGALAGLICLLALTLAGNLDPVAHDLADVVAGFLPRVAQFFA
jgi:hypothetical protein